MYRWVVRWGDAETPPGLGRATVEGDVGVEQALHIRLYESPPAYPWRITLMDVLPEQRLPRVQQRRREGGYAGAFKPGGPPQALEAPAWLFGRP